VTVYLRLTVASEAYAMPVEHVLEVAELGQVTAVPSARPELLGVRNVRGQLLPVADLARLLGITRTAPPGIGQTAQPGLLLVAEAGGKQAGFAVDEVSGVGELADPAEDTESDLLAGAVLSEGDLIGVIDVPRVFDSLDGTRP
jgi:two-component system chemotaxis response regulator CheV